MNVETKIRLHAQCLYQVEQRMANAKESMDATQLAANEETKSSAGDKYETGREMMQQEQVKFGMQLLEALKHKKVLDQINPTREYEQVQPGSLVLTSSGTFYISVSIGLLSVGGTEYMVISPVAPVGQKLIGRRAGEEVDFNGKTIRIEEVI